jgi:cytochrome c oxidase subunit 3
MSAIDPTAIPHGQDPHAGHDASHDHHAHPPHLAHHFDTPEQQFDSGKLGMWTFLATEILMFGGLFCAYAVYRYNHPDVFRYGEHHVSTFWGATNTIILLTSSLTMAMGVRFAQLGNKSMLVAMLILTLLGGLGFMVIKTIEYKDKWDHGYFPGFYNSYDRTQNPEGFQKNVVGHMEHPEEAGSSGSHADETGASHEPEAGEHQGAAPQGVEHQSPGEADATATATQPAHEPLDQLGKDYIDPHAGTADEAKIRPSFTTPAGIHRAPADEHAEIQYADLDVRQQTHVKAFFNIYFMMTGLHGLHVLIGMGLIGWITIKAARGVFSPAYFTPVDLVGLYWHLVDLIWIFLFPLLYLIH